MLDFEKDIEDEYGDRPDEDDDIDSYIDGEKDGDEKKKKSLRHRHRVLCGDPDPMDPDPGGRLPVCAE